MSQPVIPVCPTDCTSIVEVTPQFSECAPETNVGEITKVYIAGLESTGGYDGGPCFTDVEDLAEWVTRLRTDANPTGDVVEATVKGEMPEGEINDIPISGDRIARGQTAFVLNLEIDETNNYNYAMARWLSGCNSKYRVWWETAGGKLYGGNCGVEAIAQAKFITPMERTELEKIIVEVKWRARFLPERTDSPLI